MIDKKTEDLIRKQLLKNQETIAVAESVTGGLLQSAFASMQFAMQFFQGGITAYNLGQKIKHLQVDPIYAHSCNCVSERIAKEMALNVCKMFHSTYGIGITGYDTPVPESGNKVHAYYAIAKNGEIKLCKKMIGDGVLTDVKLFYVNQIVESLRGILRK